MRLKLFDSCEVINALLVLRKLFISERPPQVRFDEHCGVVEEESTFDHQATVVHFFFCLLALAVADSDVVETVGFMLSDFFFE